MKNFNLNAAHEFDERALHTALFNACATLRDRVDASSFKIYLATIIFLKHISLLSSKKDSNFMEKSGSSNSTSPSFFVPNNASFKTLFEHRKESGNGKRIDNALKAIELANEPHFDGLFESIKFGSKHFGSELESDLIFRELLEVFSSEAFPIDTSNLPNYLTTISRLYDSTIEYFAELEGRLGGEFTTPSSVSVLLSRLLELKAHETVCDPACGAGSMLVVMARETRAASGAPPKEIFGQEKNQHAWFLAKLNLFFHGEYNHRITYGDTLLKPEITNTGELQKFDVVVAHPPFSSRWDANKAGVLKFPQRFSRGLPPDSKADYAFISHMLATLKDRTGRLGVVVSHGVLFRGGIEGKIREQLIRENILDAVIGLPPKLFYNTGIPTVLLLFRKNRPPEKHSILFVDASHEFSSGRNINKLEDSQIMKIVSTYQNYVEVENFSHIVNFCDIEKNDFSLAISRYVNFESEETIQSIDLTKVRAEREQVIKTIEELERGIRTRLEFLAP